MKINIHSHVFNLPRAMGRGSREILERRARGELRPAWLGEAVGEALGDLLASLEPVDEGWLARALLARVGGKEAFATLARKVEADLPGFLGELAADRLRTLQDVALARLMDRVERVLRRNRRDAERAEWSDAVDFLRLALSPSSQDLARGLLSQLPEEGGAVVLMIHAQSTDPAHAVEDDRRYQDQLVETAQLVVAYPGRIFPFVFLDPRRSDPEADLAQALELGMVGVKLYPAIGYRVDDPKLLPVYKRCLDEGVPILQHTTPSGFYADDASIDFGDPAHWRPLLQEFPGLTICFAHFGGSSNLAGAAIPGTADPDPRRRWTRTILDLMEAPGSSRVFTDLSFHLAPVESAENAERYFRRIQELLAGPAGDRLLFGTDSWLVRLRLSEASYWRFFEEHLGAAALTRLAETNNYRFLGLPLHPGEPLGRNFQGLVERVAAQVRTRSKDLKIRPAPWLEAVLIARDPDAASALAALALPEVEELQASGLDAVLRPLADRELGDPVLDRLPVGPVLSANTRWGSRTLGLRGEADLTLQVLNDEDDPDPEGVVGVNPPAGAPRFLLGFERDRPRVVYRLQGKLHLEGEGTLAGVGLGGLAEGEVRLADYRAHPRNTSLEEAVTRDLRRPRFAFAPEQVLRIGPGEALVLARRGRLETSIDASLADTLTFGLERLSAGLGLAQPLALAVDVGIRVFARVGADDDFRLVFAGLADGGVRVEVRKAESRQGSAGFEVGAEVYFDDPVRVEELLTRAVANHLEAPLDALEQLLEETGLGALPAAQREILDAVAERLSLPSQNRLTRLRGRVQRLREDLFKELQEIARARLEVGFRYEYSRLTEEHTVLVATLSREAVEELHRSLLQGDLVPLLEAAQEEHPDVTLESFLDERVTTRQRAFGFTLRLGRWLRIGGSDQKLLVTVERFAPDGTAPRGRLLRQVSYVGIRAYHGEWQDRDWSWWAELKADMDGFSLHPVPRAAELECGVALGFHWGIADKEAEAPGPQGVPLREPFLAALLDGAMLWGALPEGSQEAGREDLARRLATATGEAGFLQQKLIGKKVEARLELRLDHGQLQRALPWVTAVSARDLALAMAAAMPHLNVQDAPHFELATRREVYAPLFQDYFGKAAQPVWRLALNDNDLADAAAARLREKGFRTRAGDENDRQGRWHNRIWTFGGLLTKNAISLKGSDTWGAWNRARPGLQRLEEIVGNRSTADHRVIPGIFSGLAGFWGQTHHMRTLGALLVAGARVGATGFSASLILRFRGPAGQTLQVALAGSS